MKWNKESLDTSHLGPGCYDDKNEGDEQLSPTSLMKKY